MHWLFLEEEFCKRKCIPLDKELIVIPCTNILTNNEKIQYNKMHEYDIKGFLPFCKTIYTISGSYVCKVVFSAAQFSMIAVHQTFYTFLHANNTRKPCEMPIKSV